MQRRRHASGLGVTDAAVLSLLFILRSSRHNRVPRPPCRGLALIGAFASATSVGGSSADTADVPATGNFATPIDFAGEWHAIAASGAQAPNWRRLPMTLRCGHMLGMLCAQAVTIRTLVTFARGSWPGPCLSRHAAFHYRKASEHRRQRLMSGLSRWLTRFIIVASAVFLVALSSRAMAQMADDPAACICLKHTVDGLRTALTTHQRKQKAAELEVHRLERQLAAAKTKLDVHDREAVAAFRELLAQNDALVAWSRDDLLSAMRAATTRYNRAAADYNARCSGTPMPPTPVGALSCTTQR
jgi:hypothetical protein